MDSPHSTCGGDALGRRFGGATLFGAAAALAQFGPRSLAPLRWGASCVCVCVAWPEARLCSRQGLTLPELSDFVQPGDLRVDARWKGAPWE